MGDSVVISPRRMFSHSEGKNTLKILINVHVECLTFEKLSDLINYQLLKPFHCKRAGLVGAYFTHTHTLTHRSQVPLKTVEIYMFLLSSNHSSAPGGSIHSHQLCFCIFIQQHHKGYQGNSRVCVEGPSKKRCPKPRMFKDVLEPWLFITALVILCYQERL